MSVFDLLFLAVAFVSAAMLGFAATCAIVGRRQYAKRVLGVFLVGAAIYLGIVTLVSLVKPRRVVSIGERVCFDDWCIMTEKIEQTASSSDVAIHIDVELSSRARRITQRENNMALYLTDSQGRRYDPIPHASDVPWNKLLGPGESVRAERVFHAPLDAMGLGLVIAHEGGFPIQWFIVGEGPFRKPPVVWLPARAPRSTSAAETDRATTAEH